MEMIAPGVWKLCLGDPEAVTPVAIRRFPPMDEALAALPEAAAPFAGHEIGFTQTSRGCALSIPLAAGDDVYGFGLQLKRHRQTGHKRTIRVNSDPSADTGDSHAPAPFYVTTGGYGVLVDRRRWVQERVLPEIELESPFRECLREATWVGEALGVPDVRAWVRMRLPAGFEPVDVARNLRLAEGVGLLEHVLGRVLRVSAVPDAKPPHRRQTPAA